MYTTSTYVRAIDLQLVNNDWKATRLYLTYSHAARLYGVSWLKCLKFLFYFLFFLVRAQNHSGVSERCSVCKTPKNGLYPAKPRIGFLALESIPILCLDLWTLICRVLLHRYVYTPTYVLYYIIPVRLSASNVRRLYQPPPLFLPRGYCSNNIFGCRNKLNDLVRVTFHILYVHTHMRSKYVYTYII